MRLITAIVLSSVTVSASVAGRYNENDLGTLFTKPSERVVIDTSRTESTTGAEVQVRRSPSSVTVNGVVKRSDGKTTVWVNGQSDMQSKTVNGVKVSSRQKRSDSVAVYVDGKLVRIKPGETWSDNKSEN